MSETIVYGGVIVVVKCWCGIRHGIPAEMNDAANRNSSFVVYCPNGHKWVRTDGLEKENERLRQRVASAQDDAMVARIERDEARRSQRATKGHLTRTKKRVQAGLCPDCHRHFPNLQAHRETKHPRATKKKERRLP